MECDTKGNSLNEDELTSSKLSDKERIRKLEAQVLQLKNVIIKLTGQTKVGEKIVHFRTRHPYYV